MATKGNVSITRVNSGKWGFHVSVKSYEKLEDGTIHGVHSFASNEQDLKDLHSLIGELLETETCKHNFIGTLPSENSECTLCGVKFSETETVNELVCDKYCQYAHVGNCPVFRSMGNPAAKCTFEDSCNTATYPPSNSEKEECCDGCASEAFPGKCISPEDDKICSCHRKEEVKEEEKKE